MTENPGAQKAITQSTYRLHSREIYSAIPFGFCNSCMDRLGA